VTDENAFRLAMVSDRAGRLPVRTFEIVPSLDFEFVRHLARASPPPVPDINRGNIAKVKLVMRTLGVSVDDLGRSRLGDA
jgi:hypothetical protein